MRLSKALIAFICLTVSMLLLGFLANNIANCRI